MIDDVREDGCIYGSVPKFHQTGQTFPCNGDMIYKLNDGSYLVATYNTLRIVKDGTLAHLLIDQPDIDEDAWEDDDVKRIVLPLRTGTIAVCAGCDVKIVDYALNLVCTLNHEHLVENMIELANGNIATLAQDEYVHVWNTKGEHVLELKDRATEWYQWVNNQWEVESHEPKDEEIFMDNTSDTQLFEQHGHIMVYTRPCLIIWANNQNYYLEFPDNSPTLKRFTDGSIQIRAGLHTFDLDLSISPLPRKR
jgi:hypothetical protein